MRSVALSHNKIKILEDQGVNVILEDFYALDGRWHWFRGNAKNDAFRLSSEREEEIKNMDISV